MTLHYAETQAIRDLLDQYFQAVGRADTGALQKIFLPESSMYGFLGEQVLAGSVEPFYSYLTERPSMVEQKIDCTYVVKSIQVDGRIAAASTLMDNFFGSMSVENLFHLVKLDGCWHIACHTFTSR